MDETESIRQAAAAVRAADALLITAGAGMGVDSGLPDFRGKEGFWRAYPVIAKLGLSFEEMANPAWFDEDPELAWAFYGHRLNVYRSTQPHAGFGQLLDLGKSMRHGYFVFTSNVDGQFQKAGFSPNNIVECHGSLNHLQCQRLCGPGIWDATDTRIEVAAERFRALPPLPQCTRCGGLARPNVLMFNDWNWIQDRTEQQEQRFGQWLEGLVRGSANTVVIELGAGSAISTVRQMSERIAGGLRGKLIRINPRESTAPPGHIELALGAANAIQGIVAALLGEGFSQPAESA